MMEKNLKNFSDVELKEELEKRRIAAFQEKMFAHEKHCEAVDRNIEALLQLVQEHSFNTCSDKEPLNAHRTCTRCLLLEAERLSDFDRDYKIKIVAEPFIP